MVLESKNKVLKCLLIDADVNSLRELSRVVINNPRLQLINTCKTGRAAVNILKEYPVDLIILNPALPDANGFDLLASLRDVPPVVIISDRQDYAYFAFRIDAIDYRVKPISGDLLNKVLDRVFLRLREREALAILEAQTEN